MAVKAKLLCIGVLLVISVTFAFVRNLPWHWLVCAALGFSWLGDAMLSRYAPLAHRVRDPFVAGMGCFALAQIVYIIALRGAMHTLPTMHMPKPGAILGISVIGTTLPVCWLAVVFFWLLTVLRTDQAHPLKIAVLLYGLIVSTMAAYACAAAFTGTGFVWILPLGGLLFMFSDACIALRLFQDRFQNKTFYEVAVWGTYVPAQICLLLGVFILA